MSKEIQTLLDTIATMQGIQAIHGESLDSLSRSLPQIADNFDLVRERAEGIDKQIASLAALVDKLTKLVEAQGMNICLIGDRLDALEHNQVAANPDLFFGETQGNA